MRFHNLLTWFALLGQLCFFNGEQVQSKGPALQREGFVRKTLHPTSSRILDIPPFSSLGVPRTDVNGNLYFRLNSTGENRLTSILKIPPTGRDATVFEFPPDAGGFLNFGVSPSGDVLMVGEDEKGNVTAIAYDGKGKASRRTELQIPKDVEIADFLVFDDGSIFIGGYYRADAPKILKGRPYAAFLADSGKVSRLVTAGTSVDFKDLDSRVFDGAASIGFDNNVYVARGEEIRIFSEGGKLIRKFTFSKPSPDFSVVNIARSVHYIALWLSRATSDGPNELNLLLVDASTHQPYPIFEPDSELGTAAVSFSDAGFRFKNSKNNLTQLQFAELR
jgi:hypothetical protein